MECIICGKQLLEDIELCNECDIILDSRYKNKCEKEEALERFREFNKKRKEEEEDE